MRELLSDKIVAAAVEDPSFIVLSGDHGYALFDGIRNARPRQFLNVGVAEQAMVGYAAGLAKTGFKPLVYGLSAFIPLRVLEQIKMDICYSSAPVIFLGDGAGLVYSTLGSSHQCGEDIACLRPLPNMSIYSPCDAYELSACFDEARSLNKPSYIRIGKSDRPAVNSEVLNNSEPHLIYRGTRPDICIVASGSMVAAAKEGASSLGVSVISVPKIKPFPMGLLELISGCSACVVIEEHSRYGGLFSSIAEYMSEKSAGARPRLISFSLMEKFAKHCGSYQYALSEHDLSDLNIRLRLQKIIEDLPRA